MSSTHSRILAVDDEPLNLDLIELAFAEEPDTEIARAVHGRAAVDLLEADPNFDVVLLDLAMPVMDGLSVLKALRGQQRFAHLPIIVITANSEQKQHALVAGATDFLAKPVDIDELRLRTHNYVKLAKHQSRLNRLVEQRTRDLLNALELAKMSEFELSSRLGMATGYRDSDTGRHIKRMAMISAKLAELAGLSPDEVETLLHAAPLHDIGKIATPDNILLKPGPLSSDEWIVMQKHAEIGAQMLSGGDQFPVLKVGRIIAHQHHERFDGSGYPQGLRGEEIDIKARIVALADVFDALLSKRPYKQPFTVEETVKYVRDNRGAHFDPVLVDTLLDNLDDFLALRELYPDEAPAFTEVNHQISHSAA